MGGLRDLVRDYYFASDRRTADTLRLTAHMKVIMPLYSKVFSKVTCKVSLALLDAWPTPQALLEAPENEVIELIKTVSRKGEKRAKEKYSLLMNAAEQALEFGCTTPASGARTRQYIAAIRMQDQLVQDILRSIDHLLDTEASPKLRKCVDILQSFRGVGRLSAAALIAEIGDINAFRTAKQLAAYFGLDPAVRQSVKFQADRQHMSKRGSAIARRILHIITMQNLRVDSKTGNPVNPPLRAYYDHLVNDKKKRKTTAMGAVSHKICRIFFAMLRDEAPYVMRTAEEAEALYRQSQTRSAV